MKKLIILIFLFICFSGNSFSAGLNLIYSEKSDSVYINYNHLEYFNGNIYWVIQKQRNVDDINNTYEATEQYIQKYNITDDTMSTFSSIFCKDNQVLFSRMLTIDSNRVTVFSDHYLKYVVGYVMQAKPRKTLYSHDGSLLFDKTDSLNGAYNLSTMGNFIQFGEKISYLFTVEPQMAISDDKILNYDSEMNILDSALIDKVSVIDDTVYNRSKINFVSKAFNSKAYIGGSFIVQNFHSSSYKQKSFVVKLMDSTGHIQWEYKHPVGDENNPTNITELKLLHDNSVAVTYFESTTASSKMMIISPEGIILKDFELCVPGKAYFVRTFIQNSENKFIVAGYARFGTSKKYWISQFSADGVKEYDYTHAQYFDEDFISSITEKDSRTYYLSSSAHQNYDAVNIVNILEYSDYSSVSEEAKSEISAYWNGYSITVNGELKEEVEKAVLFDITGRLVATQNGLPGGVFVPNTEIEPGAYILEMYSPKGKTAVKVMVR